MLAIKFLMEKKIKKKWVVGFYLPVINAIFFSLLKEFKSKKNFKYNHKYVK